MATLKSDLTLWRIVCRAINDYDGPKIVIQDRISASEARRLSKLFCGKGFTMDRRTDLHSFGNVCVVVEKMS